MMSSATVVSSAVIFPEQPEPVEPTPSPSLKRRQSSVTSETNKRPRLDLTQPADSRPLDYGPSQSPPTPAAATPPRRKASLLTRNEEKKRGQRLFGGLVSTLAQSASKPGNSQRRREDIEKRQIERLKAQNEEREEQKRIRREEIAEARKEQQQRWDEQSRRVRWENMRAQAGFLGTKTEPRLYYRPWELREDEKVVIERQRREVEEDIRKEQQELEGVDVSMEAAPATNGNGAPQEDAVSVEPASEEVVATKPLEETAPEDEAPPVQGDMSVDKPAMPEAFPDEKPKEDDHHGEELVLGQEDDVIY